MTRRRSLPRQLSLTHRSGWGGRRAGAGRKPAGPRPLVPHVTRPALATRFPVHVTLRVLPRVWNLRSKRAFRVIRAALEAGGAGAGLRVCEFSVQGNHMHFVVEAADAVGLSRGMQGLSIRIARGLNRMMGTKGKVFADRFHSRILRTPTEVARAVAYVRHNHAHHRAQWDARNPRGTRPPVPAADPWSSGSRSHGVVLPVARSWLLRHARGEIEGPAR